MEHFISDSESNKGMPHKSGVNTRESTHLSNLPWLAHWKPSSTENASEDISKLPTPSVRSKQTSDENLLQEPHYSKSGTPEADRPASKDSEQDRQKDEEEFVEVRPSLLLPGECIVARSIKNKRMEKLCDLSRGPQITTLPSQSKLVLANHSPAFKQPCNYDDQRKKIAEIPDTNVSNTVPACSLHDLETVRICTTVDKVEGVPGGPSKFSKTTHHFVITKKTDMAFSKEDQLIERSSVEAKIDRNTFLQFFGLSPPFCPCDNKDTWMKPTSCRAARAGLLNEDTHGHCYRSSDIAEETATFQQARASHLKSMDNNEIHTETGGFEASFGQTSPELVSKDNVTWKKNADSVKEMACLVHCTAQASSLNVKHESSSEMEPLNLNIFMSRDSGKGLALTAVNKDYVEAGISCDPLERITSARTKRSRNDVSPSCSAMDGCEDRKEMCASRIQSLDAEDLPAHADQPDPSQSDFSHPDQHTSSRWVKRLKHSHLEAFGTKRSVDGDISSHDKKIKLFSKVLNYGRSNSNSELLSNACIEKRQQQLVEMVILPRQHISAVDLMRESKDILSDPWIQRWRSAKGGGIQISSAEVICEPECSKVSIIEMQGKEFPSLGAMALMGKALTNFRPCEFRRMGSFVLWKTKGH